MQKISIILPVYNGARSIAWAIESVQQQTYKLWELVVLDDGSSDETGTIVQSFAIKDNRIKYIKNEQNLGIQKTLNRGLRESQGEYIARIDADDFWNDPSKLEEQLRFLLKNPNCSLVGTGAILVNHVGEEIGRYLLTEHDTMIRSRMLGKNCFVHASVMFKKHYGVECGGYSEDKTTRHVEDHDLWLRLGMVGTLANMPTHAVTLTVSSDSITAQHRIVQAWRMMGLSRRYRNEYPGFIRGYTLCVARWLFFMGISVFPIPSSLIYGIQKKVRSR